MTDTIKELIAAGYVIYQGELFLSPAQMDENDLAYRTIGFHDVSDKPFPNHCEGTLAEVWEHDYEGFGEFFVQAANARPAIKAMQAENTRLREKLGEILTIAADADDDVIADLAREGLGS